MNYLNSFLVEGKTRVEVRPNSKRTKFGFKKTIRFDVTEFLLKSYLSKLEINSEAEFYKIIIKKRYSKISYFLNMLAKLLVEFLEL